MDCPIGWVRQVEAAEGPDAFRRRLGHLIRGGGFSMAPCALAMANAVPLYVYAEAIFWKHMARHDAKWVR